LGLALMCAVLAWIILAVLSRFELPPHDNP
jgi:hypothetical protein